ncbi:hypothetical protein ERO13_D07G170225v2, partial [Gossypium hirsutum]
ETTNSPSTFFFKLGPPFSLALSLLFCLLFFCFFLEKIVCKMIPLFSTRQVGVPDPSSKLKIHISRILGSFSWLF